MTGYGRESDLQRSFDAGFDHHLIKPGDFAKGAANLGERLGVAGAMKTQREIEGT